MEAEDSHNVLVTRYIVDWLRCCSSIDTLASVSLTSFESPLVKPLGSIDRTNKMVFRTCCTKIETNRIEYDSVRVVITIASSSCWLLSPLQPEVMVKLALRQ